MAERVKSKDIDDYIAAFSPEVQAILRKIRSTIRKALPDAGERIGYQMPAFAQDGDVIYFAAFKKHIGVYPPVHGEEALMREIARYRGKKGNLQFPLDKPIPYALIGRIAKRLLLEHLERKAAKRAKK